MTLQSDILIQGGGFAGLSLALLAAKAGKTVIVVDAQSVPQRTDAGLDVRTVAISAGSRAILTPAGTWREGRFPMCPITDIQILDGDGPEVFLGFSAQEAGGDAFGHIVDNVDLRRALIDDVASDPNITHLLQDSLVFWDVHEPYVQARTKSGQDVQARLLVGADGKNSDIRKQAGIGQFGWSYKEKALVVTIEHENAHRNIAIERFRHTGPFAVLPVADTTEGKHRSAIVWTLREGDKRWNGIGVQEDIQALLPDFYGRITAMGKTQSFPLSLHNTYGMTAARLALIADAGHVMHPIAGQGLNVGLRDVAALAKLLSEYDDAGDLGLLAAYDQGRKADVTGMMVFTDQLNRLFGTRLAPVRWARRFGLKTVAKTPVLKQFFMKRAMGY